MKVQVLVFDGVFDTGLSVILDAFSTANELIALGWSGAEPFEVELVGMRRRVNTGQGLNVRLQSVQKFERPDVLVIPALGAKMPDTLRVALERPEIKDSRALLNELAKNGTTLGAACTSTFVLAATSLLDAQSATTTWWLAPLFRELYPRVTLEESKMLVSTNASRIVTAGASLGHLDLALWLIRQHSPSLAALTARYMVVDARPSQAAFVIPDHLAHADALIERFEHWVRPRLGQKISLKEVADAVGSSERTLTRRLQNVLGKSPISFIQDLRVERAVHLLQTGSKSIDQIAEQVGYSDGVTLRNLLRRKIGRGVRELRGRT